MQTVTDSKSGLELGIKSIRPYREHDEHLGIERISQTETGSATIDKRDAWLCSLNAAGDILLNREPSNGMEDYRTLEEYL